MTCREVAYQLRSRIFGNDLYNIHA